MALDRRFSHRWRQVAAKLEKGGGGGIHGGCGGQFESKGASSVTEELVFRAFGVF